jgi:prepilin-type N-terminal cleavage/methylation domain-containing protein
MRIERSGVTLIEVIVAILLFSTGALGLAATSAVITRQMTTSLHRSRSSNLARERDEKAHAAGCAAVSSGEETRDGIRATWTVSRAEITTIDQVLERPAASAVRADRVFSAVPCD